MEHMMAAHNIIYKYHVFDMEWKQPDTEGYTLYGLMYTKFKKRQSQFLVI